MTSVILKNILEDKSKIVIMHSSRSDTTVLNTNLKIKLDNCFDIQIAEKINQDFDVVKLDYKYLNKLPHQHFHKPQPIQLFVLLLFF